MKMTSADKQLLEQLYQFDSDLIGTINTTKFAKLSPKTKADLQENLNYFAKHYDDYPANLTEAVKKCARDEVLGPKWPSLVSNEQPVVKMRDPSLEEIRKQAVALTKEVKKLTEQLDKINLWPSITG